MAYAVRWIGTLRACRRTIASRQLARPLARRPAFRPIGSRHCDGWKVRHGKSTSPGGAWGPRGGGLRFVAGRRATDDRDRHRAAGGGPVEQRVGRFPAGAAQGAGRKPRHRPEWRDRRDLRLRQRAARPAGDAATRFQAASISKTINALAVLKLAEANEFRLDDPVNQRLKSWKLPDNALTAATPVTIRMLLNHTGGTTVSWFRRLPARCAAADVDRHSERHAARQFAADPGRWPPGKSFHYSGGGSTVLQQMVIDVTLGKYPKPSCTIRVRPAGNARQQLRAAAAAPNFASCAFGYGDDGTPLAGRLHGVSGTRGRRALDHAHDLALMVIGIIQSRAGRPGAFLPRNAWPREMLTPALGGAASAPSSMPRACSGTTAAISAFARFMSAIR